MTYLIVGLVALFLTMTLTPLLQRLALHIGAVDEPDGKRKVHSIPIPRIGGVLILFSFMLSCLLFLPATNEMRAILAGSLMIAGLGLTDDLIGVRAWLKFLIQWVVAGIYLAVSQPELTLFGAELPIWINQPVAAFFLVALMNAFNLQDGLDGLAAGLSIIAAMSIGVILTFSGNPQITLTLVALSGAILGFLRVNTWPARIFMGDTGSYLLGFVLGACFLEGVEHDSLPLWTGLLFFAIPLFDTFQVMVTRLVKGQGIFTADKRHLHHRLLARGYKHEQVVFIEYILASLLALIPLLTVSPLRLRWFGLILIVLVLMVFLFQYNLSEDKEGIIRPRVAHRDGYRKRIKLAIQVLLLLAVLGVYLIQLFAVRGVTLKYGLLPASLAVLYALWSTWRLHMAQRSRISFSISLVVAAQLFIFHQFSNQLSPVLQNLHEYLWIATGGLSALVYAIRWRHHTLLSNPVEYFLIFCTILVFYLPVEVKGGFRTDYLALEMLSFYAFYRVSVGLFDLEKNYRLPLLAATMLALLVSVGMLRV